MELLAERGDGQLGGGAVVDFFAVGAVGTLDAAVELGAARRQLEDEIRRDGWFVVDSRVSDLFAADPAELWRAVVRRQRGKVAMFAYFPEDPSVN